MGKAETPHVVTYGQPSVVVRGVPFEGGTGNMERGSVKLNEPDDFGFCSPSPVLRTSPFLRNWQEYAGTLRSMSALVFYARRIEFR
jgi:hypothetical protein